jgi:carbamoyl-phosphate synthase large subunit
MSTTTIKILVTAAGGDLGQAVIKALRLGQNRYEVHGADMLAGTGSLFVEHFHQLPKASDDGYFAALDTLCRTHDIQAVIPASEPEIQKLCAIPEHPLLPCGACIVSQPKAVIDTHGDKLASFKSLHGKVPLADFVNAEEKGAAESFIAEHGFPLCLKERVSSGKRGVRILSNEAEFIHEWPNFSQPVMQALIDGDDREYSVGVFVHGQDTRLISYRRRLDRLGCSWFAELDEPEEVLAYCRAVAECANVRGSINVQLRVSKKGPLLLEINPRFSSLAAARAACGFNDVEWSVLQALGREVPARLPPPSSFRFQRYIAEAVDFGDERCLHLPPSWAPRPG